MRILTAFIMLGVMIGAGACTKHTTPVVASVTEVGQERQFEIVYQSALEVLRRYQFRLDRQDRRAAMITTYPMTGQYPLEFWRRDSVTSFAKAENALQSTYLTATVLIVPDGAESFRPIVRVDVSRSNYPEAHISSSAQAYSMYSQAGGRNSWVTDFGPHQTVSYHDEELLDEEIARHQRDLLFAEVGFRTPLGRFEELERMLADEIEHLAYKSTTH